MGEGLGFLQETHTPDYETYAKRSVLLIFRELQMKSQGRITSHLWGWLLSNNTDVQTAWNLCT